MFNVYDSKTESWDVPFIRDFTQNALREWAEIANDKSNKQNQIAKYPADFTIFEIGEYDRLTGDVSIYPSKRNLGTALEHVKSEIAV